MRLGSTCHRRGRLPFHLIRHMAQCKGIMQWTALKDWNSFCLPLWLWHPQILEAVVLAMAMAHERKIPRTIPTIVAPTLEQDTDLECPDTPPNDSFQGNWSLHNYKERWSQRNTNPTTVPLLTLNQCDLVQNKTHTFFKQLNNFKTSKGQSKVLFDLYVKCFCFLSSESMPRANHTSHRTIKWTTNNLRLVRQQLVQLWTRFTHYNFHIHSSCPAKSTFWMKS